MKMKKINIKKINYRHYIALGITLCFIMLGIFVYQRSFYRLIETIKDIGSAIRFYFLNLFAPNQNLTCSVTEKSKVDFMFDFPEEWEGLGNKLSNTFKTMFTAENFTAFIANSLTFILVLYTLILFVFILLFIAKFSIKQAITKTTHKANRETKTLKAYKKVEEFFIPWIEWIKQLKNFCINGIYGKMWLLIWLYFLNVYTIIGETIAYIFYIVSSFNFTSVFIQIYKLFFDLTMMFSALPIWIWIIIAISLVMHFRKKIALNKLRHNEAKNTGFVNSLGAVTVIFGLCGGGKGTVMTDITLTMQKCYRKNAKDTMQKFDLMFPNFPFVLLERKLKKLFSKHRLYSLATIEQYFETRKRYFYNALYINEIETCKRIVFGYDFEKYGLKYDNKLYMIDLFEMLDTYSKAYYIYTIDDFTISNYAIRSDGEIFDTGNFPLWDYDYFEKDSRTIDYISSYGKILDQDILRKGKKVNPNNPLSDTLEMGIVVITELDKERGNQNDTREIKADSENANQKNDNFNYTFKLDRHPSTVDHKYYLKILCDLQRTMKTEADIRESGDNIGVGDKESDLLSMPFFFIEEFLYGLIADKFLSLYETYRYHRADNTLFMYLIKKYCGRFINYYRNTYNLYGYEIQHLKIIKDGDPESEPERHDYYLSYKKIRSKRYSTDSFVDYFRSSALKKDKGLIDYPAYADVKASRDELNMQNSYFIRKLENITDQSKE